MFKLIMIGVPKYLVLIIFAYLQLRSFIVKVNNSTSNYHRITAGVPQGSILGPLLFLVYDLDLPMHAGTKLTMFADDTTIRASAKDPKLATKLVQQHLNELRIYFAIWKMKINPAKSEAICFTRRRRSLTAELSLEGVSIPFVTS